MLMEYYQYIMSICDTNMRLMYSILLYDNDLNVVIRILALRMHDTYKYCSQWTHEICESMMCTIHVYYTYIVIESINHVNIIYIFTFN